ncbi:hypothetical protein [Parasphingorhabdus flavimaris]|jgi:hypothetical protein|uniref:PH domain-containing protein n=1 Tax=Parasphingorhabdus flavimaris TaxID=266812 RepID=A0ABX2N3G6_9SPHN|nr:hypothetical protein [Parasphingorhabdus flavimaris]NVD28253.1 hypothetical protein [Parasphingorhabdus flavimaris]|tara:strand:+ start:9583 stop:9756 length:174 start_codon:yes stop_codon:yes gene_type:complete
MSRDKETLCEWIDRLEQILAQLDSIDANIAAIHVDIAILELCQMAEVERAGGSIKAA